MALLYDARITPSKAEMLAVWLPSQPWGPPSDGMVELLGAFRFDDPEGEVGMETHLVEAADGTLLQVPLTYRSSPLSGAESSLLGETHHTVLGTRWVYDGLGDERFQSVLCAVALTGQGQALGMRLSEGRWQATPANVHVFAGGWSGGQVAVDGFEVMDSSGASPVLRNDRLDVRFHRRPVEGAQPPIGITGTWAGQAAPVVLAQVIER